MPKRQTVSGKHQWMACSHCGMPRVQQAQTAAALKKEPRPCIMTPRCEGKMRTPLTVGEAYERMGVRLPDGLDAESEMF